MVVDVYVPRTRQPCSGGGSHVVRVVVEVCRVSVGTTDVEENAGAKGAMKNSLDAKQEA